jgi:hypothetical protein
MGAITDWIFRFLPAKDGKAYGGKAPASADGELEKLTAQFLSDISGRITPARLKTILENAGHCRPPADAKARRHRLRLGDPFRQGEPGQGR